MNSIQAIANPSMEMNTLFQNTEEDFKDGFYPHQLIYKGRLFLLEFNSYVDYDWIPDHIKRKYQIVDLFNEEGWLTTEGKVELGKLKLSPWDIPSRKHVPHLWFDAWSSKRGYYWSKTIINLTEPAQPHMALTPVSSPKMIPYKNQRKKKQRELSDKDKKKIDRKIKRDLKFVDNHPAQPHVDLFGVAPIVEQMADFNEQISRVDFESLNEMVTKLNQSGVITPESINTFKKLADNTNDAAQKVNDFANSDWINYMSNLGKTATENVNLSTIGKIGSIILVITSAYKLYNERSKTNLSLLIATGVFAFMMFEDKLKIVKLLAEFYSSLDLNTEEDKAEPQMYTETVEGLIKGIIALLTGYVSFTVGKDIPQNIFKNLNSYNRVYTNAKDIVMFIIKTLETLTNWVRMNVFGCNDSMRFFQSENPILQEILDRIDHINAEVRENRFYANDENFMYITTTEQLIAQFLRATPNDQHSSNLIRELQLSKSKIEKLKDSMAATNYSLASLRQEPVAIMLRGGAGVAKSISGCFLNYRLGCDLLEGDQISEFKKNVANFIFYRLAGNRWWDTYKNHFITFYDDFGQERDFSGNEHSVYTEFIRIMNSAPCPLPCAAVEQKGTKYFQSKIIVATSNMSEPKAETIISMDAFKRRWDLLYTVVPKEQFADEGKLAGCVGGIKFDRSKLPTVEIEGVRETVLDADFSYYVKTDWKGNELGPRQTFESVVNEVKDVFYRKRRWHALQQQQLNNLMARYANERPETVKLQCDFGSLKFNELYQKACGVEMPKRKDNDRLEELSKSFGDSLEFPEDIQMEEVPAEPQMGLFDHLPTDFLREPKDEDPVVEDKLEDIPEQYKEMVDIFIANKSVSTQDLYGLNKMHDNRWDFQRPRRMYCELLMSYGRVTMKWMDEEISTLDYARWIGKHRHLYIHRTTWDFVVNSTNLRQMYTSLKVLAIEKLKAALGGIQDVVDWLIVNLPIAIPIIIFTICFLIKTAITKTLETLGRVIFGITEPQTGGYQKMPGRQKMERNSSKILASVPRNQAQAGMDLGGADLLNSICKNNSYELLLRDPDGTFNRLGYATFIKERICIVPYHFITMLAAQASEVPERWSYHLEFRRPGKVQNYSYFCTVEDFISGHKDSSLTDNDLVLVQCPRNFQPHRDITHKFIMNEDLKNIHRGIDLRVTFPDFEERKAAYVIGAPYANKRVEIGADYWEIRNSVQYSGAAFRPGECGALVSHQNTKLLRKLFAFHTAGITSSNTGYGSIVTQEMLNESMKNFVITVEMQYEPEVATAQIAPFNQGNMNEIGMTLKSPSMPTKIDLMKTELYGKWNDLFTPDEAPAEINMIYRKPLMEKSYAKYRTHDFIPDNDEWDEIVWDELNWMKKNSPNEVPKRILSYEEAIAGIEGEVHFRSIDRSTSSGYPYNVTKGYGKKSDFFGKEPEFNFDNPKAIELKKLTMEYRKNCENGIWRPQEYTDFPKGELLPKHKVEAGKVRLVSGCGMVYLGAVRMDFGSFMLWMIKNNIHNGTTIGTNVYGADWDLLVRKLMAKNLNKKGAGDYGGFDGSLLVFLMFLCLDYINRWYNGRLIDNARRTVEFLDIVFSVHVYNGFVFQWCSGMPSGNPLTPIVGSLCNKFVLRWTWNVLMARANIVAFFSAEVYLCVQSDDNVWSVTPEYSDIYNEYTVGPVLAQLGMKYTPEVKTKSFEEGVDRNLCDIEYLKRSFRYDETLRRWVAPLRLQKLLEMPYWHRNNDNRSTFQKTEQVVMELALHGKEVWEKYAPRIIREYEDVFGNTMGWFRCTTYQSCLETISKCDSSMI
jgi:hypothetical protein